MKNLKLITTTAILVAFTLLFVYCLGTYSEYKRMDYKYDYKTNVEYYNSNNSLLAQEDETYYFGETFPEVEVIANEIKQLP